MSGGENVFCSSKSKESIQNFKARMKRNLRSTSSETDKHPAVVDVYEKAQSSIGKIRKPTGIVFDPKHRMAQHKCEWDPNYPENPNRYHCVLNRFNELGLIERCKLISCREATPEEIKVAHMEDIYNNLENICKGYTLGKLEEEASKFDSIYFNKETFEAATIAAGCCLNLIEEICTGKIQNGFAVVRPPGHHAMQDEYCGYCFFNNVVVGAHFALNNNWAKKILIVDYDVHHGQGTQRAFYQDKRVLYFSIHRYEKGTFWPHLRESNFDYIGSDEGKGYNINVPLNEIGLGDGDYLNIVHNILLPVAYEFQPELILISAGYDACIGCSEGRMKVSPGFYSHLITSLSGLAEGRIAVCLEGGYFPPSLAEGAAMTLKALLDDPPPILLPLEEPRESVKEVVTNLKGGRLPLHTVKVEYLGEPLTPPHPTRNCYPTLPEEEIAQFSAIVEDYKKYYAKLGSGHVVGFAFHEDMLAHVPPPSTYGPYPENPNRLAAMWEMFSNFKFNDRCVLVPSKNEENWWFEDVHDPTYVKEISSGKIEFDSGRDVYFTKDSWSSIRRAARSVVEVVDSVLSNTSSCGVAIIRPPGHHALPSEAMGYCLLNNVSVGANYAIKKFDLKKILIIDFDIHHGNGTQAIWLENKNVLYISVHRYDHQNFYPYTNDGAFNIIGKGEGEGYNINIPLNARREKVTGAEYIEIFQRIILPVAYEYSPELVIVSAGFDAGVHDPLGGYWVEPEAFGHFTQLLKPLAQGRIIVVTEGGYNLTTISCSLCMCVKALLGDPLPPLSQSNDVNKSVKETITHVIDFQKEYWKSLRINKFVPANNVYELEEEFEKLCFKQ